MTRTAGREPETRAQQRREIVVGLLAAPGLAHDLALGLQSSLPAQLRRRFPGVEWRIAVKPDPLAAASNSDVDLVETARRRALEEGWQLAICLTDFPVHVGTRPVTAYASAAKGVGLVSVPALGAVNLQDRVADAVLRLIEGLLGESVERPEQSRDATRRARMNHRLEELASPVGHARVEEGGSLRFVTAVVRGNARLLAGMVRANRPWRLIAGMSRALVGALGLDIFGVASPGVWILSSGLGWPRLALFGVASVLVISTALVVGHRLWERSTSPRPEARERVVLFNLATAITIAIGVLTMYLVLFVINVVAAAVLISEHVLAKQIGKPVDVGDYLALAWLVTSLATLGGALGAALENDHVVREAAYGYRRDARIEAEQQEA